MLDSKLKGIGKEDDDDKTQVYCEHLVSCKQTKFIHLVILVNCINFLLELYIPSS